MVNTDIRSRVGLKVIKDIHIKKVIRVNSPGAILELVVTDKDGRVTERREMPSRSFVRQFLELLWVQGCQLPSTLPYQVRDTGNALRNCYCGGNTFAVNGGVGNVSCGIIIGTGAVAPTINNYVIGTIIPHATMNYGAVTFGAPANDATTSQVTITRNFANVSGGGVTVNEIALYGEGYDTTSAYRYFMLIRDTIGGGILVPNGQTLTVNYRIQSTVPGLTRGLVDLLYVHLAQITPGAPYSITDLDGVARNVDSNWTASLNRMKSTFTMNAAPGGTGVIGATGIDSFNTLIFLDAQKLGILVGTGVAAVAPTDRNLGTRILHGRAAGQFEYGGCGLINFAIAAPNATFDVRRYFTNLSGGAITVNEAGISVMGTRAMGGGDNYVWPFLIDRDLVAPGVTVNNTELLRVTYTIQITV